MRVMILAGEPSGDQHAARLLRAMRSRNSQIDAFGVGGDSLASEGMELLVHCDEMAVVGLTEVLSRYFFFRGVMRDMVACVKNREPDVVIFVDYPGFNLRMAQRIDGFPCKKIYYICPQVWAWNRSRMQLMARVLDRLISIFPFEPPLFQDVCLPADFVGHPLIGPTQAVLDSPPTPLSWGSNPGVALLPGSRTEEVDRMLPVMAEAAAIIAAQRPGTTFALAAASQALADQARAILGGMPESIPQIAIEVGQTRQVLKQARGALVTSGTATLEAGLMECPMVIGYRLSSVTYWIGRSLVQVEHIGMVNIIADRRLCPEFIQGAVKPQAMAEALLPLLEAGSPRSDTREGLRDVRRLLQPADGEKRAAEIILQELEQSS